MKRRKRKVAYVITTFIIVFFVVALSVSSPNTIKSNLNIFTKYFNSEDNKQEQSDIETEPKSDVIEEETEEKTEEKKPEQQQIEQLKYNIKLSDNVEIEAIYEITKDEKRFIELKSQGNEVDYDISPSKKSMVVYDKKTQDLIHIDIEGKTKNISKMQYVSKKSKFTRESILEKNEDYTWCKNPAFIDNENIAYVSELPWFKKDGDFYIWVVNIKNEKTHNRVSGLKGKEVAIGEISDKGLKVIVDGKDYYVNSKAKYTK